MRYLLKSVWMVASLFLLTGVLGNAGEKSGEQKYVSEALRKVFPALVRISVVSTQPRNGREIKELSYGSGAIISPDGYVVTNHHVVGHGVRIWVTLSNRQRVDAKLIGTDPLADIAIIKLLPQSMRHPVKKFPVAKWGDSSTVKAGDEVFAMGSPGAMAQSITYGIVANPSMTLGPIGGGFVLDGEPVGSVVRWIMHDAQIFGGNSGGPLVNIKGEIIGINEIGTAALGGAIPANTAHRVADELIKNGYVQRSWTGIMTQKLLRSEKAEEGVLVNGLIDGSPGEQAGLQPGDLILAVNGKPVQVRYDEQMPEFNRLILEAPVGSTLDLTVRRAGKSMSVKVTTIARGKAQERDHEVKSWGITARDVSNLTRIRMRRNTTDGVMVSTFRPGGPVGQARPRLYPGDIITAVGSKPIKNLTSLMTINHAIMTGKTEAIPTLVTYWRRGESFMTVVKIGPLEEPPAVPTMRKSWFPAKLQVLTKPLAKALGMAGTKGMRITRIYPQMKDAGFMVGDIITHVDGMLVDASEPQHAGRFPTMIRRIKVGNEADFKIIRGKEKSTIKYKLTRAPRPLRELPKYKNDFLEFRIRQISIMDRNDLRLPENQEGVIFDEVKNGGWVYLGGLRVRDIVLRVGQTEIKTVADFKKAMQEIIARKPETISFFVKRGLGNRFAEVRPDWSCEKE